MLLPRSRCGFLPSQASIRPFKHARRAFTIAHSSESHLPKPYPGDGLPPPFAGRSPRAFLDEHRRTEQRLLSLPNREYDVLADNAKCGIFRVNTDKRVSIYCARPDKPLIKSHLKQNDLQTPRDVSEYWSVWLWRHYDDHFVKVSETWLRDVCQCSSCINQDTRQRQFDTYADTVMNARISDLHGLPEDDAKLRVTWHDGHESSYDKQWISRSIQPRATPIMSGQTGRANWKEVSDKFPPRVQYDDVRNGGKGMTDLMNHLRRLGFCFIKGTPLTPDATQSVLEEIGPIRNTHYGGFYDFTSDLSSKDTAYTSQYLAPHTDTTYFTEPVALQAFHIISHTSPDGGQGEGGATLLVDGFRAAAELSTDVLDTLSTRAMYSHSSGNEGVSIRNERGYHVLQRNSISEVCQVRWNNDDRAGFAQHGINSGAEFIDQWYRAAAEWNKLVNTPDPRWYLQHQLQPGELLIFDNWRVLHGRTAFTGKRRMCGAYISRDDYISRWKNANFTREQILDTGIY